jgi:hypothetical protein
MISPRMTSPAGGRRQAQTGPLEQRHADEGLELLQAVADGTLGQTQLVRRQRHAAMAGGRLERDETIERGERTHRTTMKEIHADMNS